MIRAAFAIVFLPVLVACTGTGGQAPSGSPIPNSISVLDVIDGDTIDIAGPAPGQEIRVRLVGYDTPETRDSGCPQELALGNKATRRLQAILHDARDIRTQAQGNDRYNRLLLRLIIDDRSLAKIMIAEGLAVPYDGGRRINWCQRLARS